jgi:hypothetical protein
MSSNRRNAGVRNALFAFIVIMVLHIFALMINNGYHNWDYGIWIIQILLYIIIANAAASKQDFINRENTSAPCAESSAALTATMMTSLMVWGGLIVRHFVLNYYSIILFLRGVSVFFWVLVDFSLAIIIGRIVGRNHETKYSDDSDW